MQGAADLEDVCVRQAVGGDERLHGRAVRLGDPAESVAALDGVVATAGLRGGRGLLRRRGGGRAGLRGMVREIPVWKEIVERAGLVK